MRRLLARFVRAERQVGGNGAHVIGEEAALNRFIANKPMTKKPKGWNSVIELSSGKAFSPIVLPEAKSEREKLIANWFCASLKSHGTPELQILQVTQNREDDFDFQITTPEGHKTLELTEFAPFSAQGGFSNATDQLNVGATADALTNMIMRKADHYPHKPVGLVLLVYVTHYAFQPLEDVYRLVEDRVGRLEPFFERIFFMIPNSAHASELRNLYPTSCSKLTIEEIKRMRQRWFANGDFSREAWTSTE